MPLSRNAMNAGVAVRAVLLAAALVIAGLLVQQLVTLLLALAITVIISLPLATAADWAGRRGVPRVVGAVLGLFAVLAVVAAVLYLVIPPFVSEFKQFANSLPTTIAEAERYLHRAFGLNTQTLSRDLTQFVQGYTHHPQRLIAPLERIGLSAVGIVAGVVVVLITAMYIAINPDPLTEGALRLFPRERRALVLRVGSRVRTAWLGWLRAIGIDMLVLGGLLFVGMKIIGLSFAAGFAIFSAVCTVIPNYGSIISAVPPIVVGLASSPGKALLVLAVYVIVNQIEGNLILPLVMARSVDIHPAIVAIGVLVMAQLFGLIGVIIAIPLISLFMILVEELWIRPQEEAAGPYQVST